MKGEVGKFIDQHPWGTGAIVVVFLTIVVAMFDASLPDAIAQDIAPAALAQRQIQTHCVSGEDKASGQDICDIGHFDSLSQDVVHFLAPDPLSARLQGDFRNHCATFIDIPSYVSVLSLNVDTMEMEVLTDNSSVFTCEAFFTLTEN